jgi:hypothetical protein
MMGLVESVVGRIFGGPDDAGDPLEISLVDGQIQAVFSAKGIGLFLADEFAFCGELCDLSVHIVRLGQLDHEESQDRDQEKCGDEHEKTLYDVPADGKVAVHMAPGGGFAMKIYKK